MQCSACKEKFAAIKGFDAHRDSRRNKCIPPAEVPGMAPGRDGYWTYVQPKLNSS